MWWNDKKSKNVVDLDVKQTHVTICTDATEYHLLVKGKPGFSPVELATHFLNSFTNFIPVKDALIPIYKITKIQLRTESLVVKVSS